MKINQDEIFSVYVGLSEMCLLPVSDLIEIGICRQNLAKISSTIFQGKLTDCIYAVLCGRSEERRRIHDETSSRYSQLLCRDT